VSRNKLLDQACDLAHQLEVDLRQIQDRTSECIEHRSGGIHFLACGINNVVRRILSEAHDLATDLEFGNAVACDNALGSNITAARNLAKHLDYARGVSRGLVRGLALDRPSQLSRERGSYVSAEVDARRLIRDFARTRNKALYVAKSVARARGHAWDVDLLKDLESLLAAFVAKDREEILQQMAATTSTSNDIARGALRLTSLAAKVLPASERSRYCEEWRAELLALSEETATPRREQIRHGWRVLKRSLGLRFALLWEPAAKRERA
jgi:hypothetical protein